MLNDEYHAIINSSHGNTRKWWEFVNWLKISWIIYRKIEHTQTMIEKTGVEEHGKLYIHLYSARLCVCVSIVSTIETTIYFNT